MPKTNHLVKSLKQTCPVCQTIYQLLETHSRASQACLNKCHFKWQAFLQQYHQEQIILHLNQEAEERELNHLKAN